MTSEEIKLMEIIVKECAKNGAATAVKIILREMRDLSSADGYGKIYEILDGLTGEKILKELGVP